MKINLLPWREYERQNLKKHFMYSILMTIISALILIVLLHFYYRERIAHQQLRNKYLQDAIDIENMTLVKLKKDKQQLMEVNSELQYIVSLRDKSYDAVRALDELVRIVPEGVSFLSIARNGKAIILTGEARSDLQVTQFMANIAKSAIFQQPVLTKINSLKTNQGEEREFTILVDEKAYSLS